MEVKTSEEIIIELRNEIIDLKNKLLELETEKKELDKKYLNLRCRYTNQNNELILLKVKLNGGTNDNN